MRIGIYISGINEKSGGAYTFEQGILESLLKLKNKKDLYVFSKFDNEIPQDTQIKFIKLEKPSVPSPLKRLTRKLLGRMIQTKNLNEKYYISTLDKAVKINKIDILWYATQYFEPVDIPYIFTVWDLNHRIHPYFPEVSVNKMWLRREEACRNIIPRATYILTGTETGKQEIIKYCNILEKRIKVLPFPAPNKHHLGSKKYDLKKDFGIQNDYLIYPSAFHPHKNHIRILEALLVLDKKYGLNYSAVFVGTDCGNKSYLKQKCQEFNLESKVKFFKFIPRDQLIYLYQHAFALVYASYFGPDNIPPLEAFSFKCPVIASRVSGAEEQLGNKAILVDPNRAEDFAFAVVKLSKNSKFREQMTERAFKHVNKWTFNDYTLAALSLMNKFSSVRSSWGDDINHYY